MSDVFEAIVSVSVLSACLRIATPLLLAAIGEMVTERAGILNLGIEGTVTVGAFSSFVVVDQTGSLWFGIVGGIVGAMALAALMAFLTVTIKVEQVVAGLALNLVGLGISFYLLRAIFDSGSTTVPTVSTFSPVEIPLLSDIPAIGNIFFSQHWLTYFSVVLAVGVWVGLERTTYGLELRSVGHNPEACDMRGIPVHRVQYAALLFGGFTAGLAGAFLSIFSTGLFFPDIVGGRGWIALAIVIFGNWRVGRILIGAVFFGFLEAYQLSLQSRGVDIPDQLLLSLPFLLTIVALVFNRARSREPLHLGVPYYRGER
ncbi:ABC transporter permease [Candidatus Poriferisocius sp.]|uniref:ABC transporter permease n=1 Tax=Candidatus Poriferisocius sp. TaxID=3101276 RepID=UPI003B02843B